MLNRKKLLNYVSFVEIAAGIVAVILLLFSPIVRLKFNLGCIFFIYTKGEMITKKQKI